MIGSTLSHFKITAKLGEGGMGEVYRAEDTKLGREVAIKVLPEAVAQDPERLARFEREAKVLASLNHPNIAAIYSLESAKAGHYSDDEGSGAEAGESTINFLVMELVEGNDLRTRLGRGAVTLDEAMPIALQIAHALEAAHAQGIIHRDLKPANVMVDEEDSVKVLDFGLAKALDSTVASNDIDPSGSPLSLSPTLTAQMTGAGVLLGTAAYMSPEQARGKKADKRADIWAFGVVLWEMLTGQRLFDGETVSDTLAAVLRAEPDWDSLPNETPRPIHRLLHRCLERNPKERLHDIADARLEIESAINPEAAGEAWGSTEEPPARGRSVWTGLVAGLALGVLVTFLVTTLGTTDKTMTTSSTLRVASGTPEGEEFQVFNQPAIAISPDGQRLVISMLKDDEFMLYQRPLHQYEWSPIPGTEDAFHPFFSPDGEWVGFFTDGKLNKVSLAGGAPQVLCDAPNPYGGAWGPNGKIVFNSSSPGGLHIVSELGGTAEVLTEPDFESGESEHDWPQMLPDGRSVIFSIWKGSSAENSQIALWDLESSEKTILIDGSFGRVTSSGHLLFARADSVYVVPFDPEARTILGEAVPIPEPIYRYTEYWMPILDVSSSGTLAYLPGRSDARHQLVTVAPDGTEKRLIEATGNYMYPRLSPDGQKLAVTMMESGKGDISIFDLGTGTRTRLTREGHNHAPLWTSDGERVIFMSNRDGLESILWQAADGSDQAETLVASDASSYVDFLTDVSPDGKYIVHSLIKNTENAQFESSTVQLLSLENPSETKPLIDNDNEDLYYGGAVISPDGRWLAYVHSDADTPFEIYLQAFPDGGARHKISQEGGLKPRWAPDGRAIYFRAFAGEPMMMVPFSSEPALEIGTPQPLFDDIYSRGVYTALPAYDTLTGTPNLIMVKPDEELGRSSEIRLVLNWLDELEALVPGGGR